MFGEKCFHNDAEGTTVFGSLETMPFVGEQYVGHRDLLLLHRLNDLVGLTLFYARVVRALSNQERLLDSLYERQR